MRALTALLTRRVWVLPALLGLLYFVIQLFFIGDYGVTWDEPLHRSWGKLLIVYWQTGDFSNITMMPGKGMYYGHFYYLINYILSEWLFQNGWMDFIPANHFLNIFTASIGVGLVFLLGRAMGGMRLAIITTIFFVLFPQLIAHAQYNPKDIPLMVAILAVSVMFLHALQTQSRRLFLLCGFLFGIAFALKVSALLMAPVFLMTYFIGLWGQGSVVHGFRRDFRILLGASILFLVAAYLFWPSAWTHPALIFQSLSLFTGADYWPGQVLFFGKEYGGADLPWFYTSLEYLMAMPVLLVLFFVVGAGVVVAKIRHGQDVVSSVFLLLWIFFPLLLTLKPDLVRYDGMRQFFFTLPALVLVAAFGFEWLLSVLTKKFKSRFLTPVFIGLVLVSLMHEVVLLHPFEGSYRNEVVRFLIPESMDRTLEIEYWGASYKQGMDWLTEHAEPSSIVCVPTAELLIEWYPRTRSDLQFGCTQDADYIMFFTRYSRKGDPVFQTQEPVFRIRRMNADLLKIYKV